MSLLDHYRGLYEYEKDCNRKMLSMIDSVPDMKRGDAPFKQAVSLAGHLAACRENWLDRMEKDGLNQVAWFDNECDLSTLQPRFTAIENRWTDYLARIDEAQMARDFEFPLQNGQSFSLRTEVQIVQLVGHASYHRGQVALLVDQLGGETVDSDYLYWATPR